MNFFLASTNYWIHDLSPFLLEFSGDWRNWGPGGIRWYGISYLLGFISAYFLFVLYHKHQKSPYDKEQIMNLITFQVIGILIGGRIGYLLLYQGDKFISDPLSIMRVWEGGMASHGGFIGVFIATFWYAKKSNQSIKPIGDMIVSVVPPGLLFGRIANFINGELYGKPATIMWSVIFPEVDKLPRHPSQIYEALLEGILLFIILIIIAFNKKIKTGVSSSLFLTLYGLFRIFSEFFREPDKQIGYLFSKISMGTTLSIVMILAGLFIFFKINKDAKNK